MNIDDNILLLMHFNPYPLPTQPTNHSIHSAINNNTLNANLDQDLANVHFVRAILAFLCTILLYFCLVCHVWKEEVAGGKPEVIAKSLVRKKVLPHGQSRHFDEIDTTTVQEEDPKTIDVIYCCHRSNHDTATSIIESYKLKSFLDLRAHKLKQRFQREHPELTVPNDDGLDLAEEGAINSTTTDTLCPVCLEAFHIGDEVTWSKLQHCHHVFHYECILPWAVLGHVHCPVCREVFWSRHLQTPSECRICFRLRKNMDGRTEESVLERSRFCVLHGLVSPESVPDEAG